MDEGGEAISPTENEIHGGRFDDLIYERVISITDPKVSTFTILLILENLKEFNIETRAEVKAIEDALIKYEKLNKRDISVKERKERERFQNL